MGRGAGDWDRILLATPSSVVLLLTWFFWLWWIWGFWKGGLGWDGMGLLLNWIEM